MALIAVSQDSKDFLRELSAQLNLPLAEPAKMLDIGPAGLSYWNCYEYAQRYGGRIVNGWQVLAWPDIYIELLHHTVIEDVDGHLLDPTICTAVNSGHSVFIRDKSATISRSNPPPIQSRFIVYPGEGAREIGWAARRAKEHCFELKRRLARIMEENGIVAKPVIANYPWPKTAEVTSILAELECVQKTISELNESCATHLSNYRPRHPSQMQYPRHPIQSAQHR